MPVADSNSDCVRGPRERGAEFISRAHSTNEKTAFAIADSVVV